MRNAAIGLSNSLAQAMVETVRTPLIVLDANLRVHAANPAFYQIFKVEPSETEGRLLYEALKFHGEGVPPRVGISAHAPTDGHGRRAVARRINLRTWAAGTPRLEPPNSGMTPMVTATTSPSRLRTGPPLPPLVVSASYTTA